MKTEVDLVQWEKLRMRVYEKFVASIKQDVIFRICVTEESNGFGIWTVTCPLKESEPALKMDFFMQNREQALETAFALYNKAQVTIDESEAKYE